MRRREFLAAAAGAAGTALAGCAGLSAPRTATVTPAAVPATPTETESEGGQRCPALPADAETVVCSPEAGGEGLRLVTLGELYPSPEVSRTFRLRNDTGRPFETGRDWWTLAERTPEGWGVLARGEAADSMTLDPGGSYVWVLGSDVETAATVPAAGVTAGRYALSVTGYGPAGDLVAVVAPFRVG